MSFGRFCLIRLACTLMLAALDMSFLRNIAFVVGLSVYVYTVMDWTER